ncbi:MAG: medium chain dehydrogenase/reductase family protein [Anaerolineae bacterium]|nr:medium chain dehydrogenase/reductase family protein [Anaerolineae bacterium]
MAYQHIVIQNFGAPDVLDLITADTLPEPGPGEVRVKVLAASASFSDMLIRRGIYPMLGQKPPLTPGYDMAGVVDALGPGVSGLREGQMVADLLKTGGYTEYLVRPAASLVPVPEGVDPAAAVSMVLTYVTAYQMLHRIAQVPAGGTILVHGGGGAVGSALLELGRLHGCTLIATASPASRAVVEQFGATAIDYKTEDFVARVQEITGGAGVDAAFDAVSGKNMQRSFKTLKRGGTLAGYGFGSQARGDKEIVPLYFLWLMLANALPNGKRAQFYGIAERRKAHPDQFTADLGALFVLLVAGKLNPVIQEQMPLSEVQRAHQMLDAGGIKGKLVLRMHA